jgi:hypothetical protein
MMIPPYEPDTHYRLEVSQYQGGKLKTVTTVINKWMLSPDIEATMWKWRAHNLDMKLLDYCGFVAEDREWTLRPFKDMPYEPWRPHAWT